MRTLSVTVCFLPSSNARETGKLCRYERRYSSLKSVSLTDATLHGLASWLSVERSQPKTSHNF